MITSTSSSQVKHVISLLSKARERKKNKEYVVEGVRMVSEVPADLLDYGGCKNEGQQYFRYAYRQSVVDSC